MIALDQYMPGLDGLETLARIRAIENAPPVVFVTASLDSRIAVTALKAGAADYLVKDTQGEFIPLLAVAVAGALNGARMRQAKEAAEAEVRAARDRYAALAAERELLLREVNHRVGNSLQIIASLLHLQASSADEQREGRAHQRHGPRRRGRAGASQASTPRTTCSGVMLDQYLEGAARGPAPLGRRREADPADAARPSRSRSIPTAPWRSASSSTSSSSTPLKYAYPGRLRPDPCGGRAAAAIRSSSPSPTRASASPTTPAPGSTGIGRRIVDAMAAKLDAKHQARQRRRPARAWP